MRWHHQVHIRASCWNVILMILTSQTMTIKASTSRVGEHSNHGGSFVPAWLSCGSQDHSSLCRRPVTQIFPTSKIYSQAYTRNFSAHVPSNHIPWSARQFPPFQKQKLHPSLKKDQYEIQQACTKFTTQSTILCRNPNFARKTRVIRSTAGVSHNDMFKVLDELLLQQKWRIASREASGSPCGASESHVASSKQKLN